MRRIIAMLDRAEGNAEVGEMWTETRSFAPSDPISAVMDWAGAKATRYPHGALGTLRLQFDEAPNAS